jgi:hypothetical protein
LTPRRLRLELAPSPSLAIAVIALHAAAASSVWVVLPGIAGRLLAALLFALGVASAWSRALLRARSSVRVIEIEGAKAALQLAGGEGFPAEIAQRRYVARFLVILPVVRPVRRTILVTPDMLGRDSFRRLRIWALWGKLPGVARGQLAA